MGPEPRSASTPARSPSPRGAIALVAERVREQPGRPVIGFGHRPGALVREVTVAELDEVSGVTPVVLIAGDAHHAWLNSAALAALGLGARDEVVRENEWFAAYELLDRAHRRRRHVARRPTAPASQAAAGEGVVGLVDFEFSGGADEWVERWHAGLRPAAGADGDVRRPARGGDRRRPAHRHAAGRGRRPAGDGPAEDHQRRLAQHPHRLVLRAVRRRRPASSTPAARPTCARTSCVALLARAHMSGLDVATHAIGDAAVDRGPRRLRRHRRARLDRARPAGRASDDVARLAALGLRACVQPAHLLDDRDLTELIWPGRGERCFAFRWMLDAGVALVLGSDAPVSPLDPWLAMAAAVHRSADDRDAWHPEHALTAREALAASVDEQPTVGVGSRGDLVLLDHDPLAPAGSTARGRGRAAAYAASR